MKQILILGVALIFACGQLAPADDGILRAGTFEVDASPPIGSMMAYDPAKGVQTPLSCRGIVLAGAGKPLVLCAIDWIGISNGGQTEFKEAIAAAVGTEPDRVVIHALHQHDAPRCDLSAEEILTESGFGAGEASDPRHAREVAAAAAEAAATALRSARPVTQLGLGHAPVDRVASNRRILGPDGKVQYTRYTATKDPKVRDFPAGTVDPELKLISLWSGDEPIVVLTYFATHPQSYYRTGMATPDFPGLARNQRQTETGVPHLHFNGAGGNVGAGKWNDGAPENRQVLTDRVAEGMRKAWETTEKSPLSSAEVAWTVAPVVLPVSEHLKEDVLLATVANRVATPSERFAAAKNLTWLRRCRAGDPIPVSCLRLGKARLLHLPGELFVEYQLAAQQLRPDLFVAMAAYGDYAPGYIGTAVAYGEGGYETSPKASKVAPEVEEVLMGAIRKLLEKAP